MRERARPGQARLLVAAIPDGIAMRQIADYRRSRYPDLPFLVRTHNREEQAAAYALKADMAFVGEEELAIQVARYALQRFGLSLEEADTLACSWRPRDEGTLPALE